MSSEINNRIAKLAVARAVKGYTWNDIADQINAEFGTTLSGDACRKRASYAVLTEEFDDPAEDMLVEDPRSPEMQILSTLKDERAQANALYRRLDREESLKLIAKEAVAEMTKQQPLTSLTKMYSSNIVNEALLLLGDWHYGIEINSPLNVYSPDICKARVAELATTIIEKIKENKISKLYVLNLGDMIAGIIHLQLRINSRLDVLSQAMQVSEVIADFLYDLSKYTEISYYQVLDNHSRIDPNKKESLQLESLARLTPWWLKERLAAAEKKYHTITINDNEFDQDIALFYINNDYLVAGVHGDKDKPKNIAKNLKAYLKEDIDLICSAHLHHFSMDEDTRTVCISNGSLMGTDDFASKLRLDSMPSQTLVTFKDSEAGTDIDAIYKLNSYIFS